MKCVCEVVSFVLLLFCCLVLEFVTVALFRVCPVDFEVGSLVGFFVDLTSVIHDASVVLFSALL